MTLAADFGPLLVETDVDAAVIDRLYLWMPTYLAQVERERGMANRTLHRPVRASYATVLDDDGFPTKRLPAILVTTASTADAPELGGDDTYSTVYEVAVTAVVRGRTSHEARVLASLYAGSIRRLLLQQQDNADTMLWTGSSVASVADTTAENRHLAGGINTFSFYADRVVQAFAGPTVDSPVYEQPDPAGDPDSAYDPLVDVDVINVDVTAIPVTASPGG